MSEALVNDTDIQQVHQIRDACLTKAGLFAWGHACSRGVEFFSKEKSDCTHVICLSLAITGYEATATGEEGKEGWLDLYFTTDNKEYANHMLRVSDSGNVTMMPQKGQCGKTIEGIVKLA